MVCGFPAAQQKAAGTEVEMPNRSTCWGCGPRSGMQQAPNKWRVSLALQLSV